MKKFLALAALVLGMVSCQQDYAGLDVDANGEAAVTVSVAIPEMETRAGGESSALGAFGNIDLTKYDVRYILEVYDHNGVLAKERLTNYEDEGMATAFNLRLIPGRAYRFVVWADFVLEGKKEDLHYNTSDLCKIKAIPANLALSDESRDAYTGIEIVANFSNSAPIAIELKRPLGKLRVVTTDVKDMYTLLPEDVTVVYTSPIYTVFNAYASDVDKTETIDHGGINVKISDSKYAGEWNAEGKVKEGLTLFTDYFFAAKEQEPINFTLNVTDTSGLPIPQVVFSTPIPIQRNYLTTVTGPILTDSGNITVTIDDAFAGKKECTVVETTEALAAAVAAAKDGDTILIDGEVTMPYFTNKALNFFGISEKAVVKQSPATHIDTFYSGATLNFKNVKLVGEAYKNNTQGYQKSVKESYENCHFVDYIMFTGETTTIKDCTFENNKAQYFWTGTAKNITFENCVFNGLERAVKVCTVGNTGVERKVNFTNCEFTATELNKAAIEIDGSKGSSYIVNINNCTETGFAKGEFTDLAMFNVEGAENVDVYLDGAKWVRNGVMEKNGELFAYNAGGLQYLLDNAVNDVTINIIADIEGDVTVTQKAGVKITIEGNDHKFAGVITVDGKSATYTTAGVTIKNLNFEAETISADACIRLGNGTNDTRYACNVAVEGCAFNVPGVVAVKSYTGGDKNLSIKNCTGVGLHSLLQVKNVEGITIEGVNVNAGRGASFGVSSGIFVKNSTFVAESYGLRADATAEVVLNIENVNITAKLPVVARKTSENYTINFTGVNNLVANGYQVVFTTGDDEATFVAPTEYTLTGADGFKVFPRDAEANNFVYTVDDFKKAIEAGNDGETIILQGGVIEGTFLPRSKNLTIKSADANNKATIKGRVNIDGYADGIKFENIKFDINDDSKVKNSFTGANYKYPATVVIYGSATNFEGCEFKADIASGVCGINYASHVAGKLLKVNNCKFQGDFYAIRTRTLFEITNNEFDIYTDQGTLAAVWTWGNGEYGTKGNSGANRVVFTGNNNVNANKVYGVQLTSSTFNYCYINYNVQGNTNFYELKESINSARDFEGKTFEAGSETF